MAQQQQQQQQQLYASQQQQTQQQSQPTSSGWSWGWIHVSAELQDDLRLALLVVAAFVVVSLVPVADLAAKCMLPLERLPYGELILRAVMLSMVVVMGRKV